MHLLTWMFWLLGRVTFYTNSATKFVDKVLPNLNFSQKWNVTPLIWRGSHFLSSQHFIALALVLMHCFQARGTRVGNKGITFKKGAFNCCIERKISSTIKMCGLFSPYLYTGTLHTSICKFIH